MLKYSRTYTLDKTDTIDVISKKFRLKPDEIKIYHNTYCDLRKRIYRDLPTNLTEIILPPLGVEIKNGKIVDLDKKEHITLGHPNYPLVNITSLDDTYGVVIKREVTGKEPLQLHYKIHIKYKAVTRKGEFEIELNREQVYINNKAPDLIAEKLADDCGSVLYPVRILINRTGELVGVTNALEIKNRWNDARKGIAHYYQSELTENLLGKMDKAYGDQHAILEALQSNLFLNFYFSKLYQAHQNYEVNYIKEMPITSFGRKYLYHVKHEVEPFLTNTKKIKLRMTGVAQEIGTKTKIDMHFKLTSPDHIIFAIEGEVITERDHKEEKIKLQAHRLTKK